MVRRSSRDVLDTPEVLMTPEITIAVRDGLYLSSVRPIDKPALLEHFVTKDIYNTTLTIPYPYTAAHADSWINRRVEWTARQGKEVCFAIRETGGKLIGIVSADHLEIGTSHKAEIGYWLARPYWGQGIMTDAVRVYVGYAFAELQLLRLVAHVFEFNLASARVLERNGFQLEGRLRKHLRKDGKLIDARFYGLLKEDLSREP
jgi:ribosomal-protein-alanine N-acetyltransferase